MFRAEAQASGRTGHGEPAAAGFAGLVAETTRPDDGTHRFVIEQGYGEMGRPSQIELGMTIERQARSHALPSAGSAIIVSDGHIEA